MRLFASWSFEGSSTLDLWAWRVHSVLCTATILFSGNSNSMVRREVFLLQDPSFPQHFLDVYLWFAYFSLIFIFPFTYYACYSLVIVFM